MPESIRFRFGACNQADAIDQMEATRHGTNSGPKIELQGLGSAGLLGLRIMAIIFSRFRVLGFSKDRRYGFRVVKPAPGLVNSLPRMRNAPAVSRSGMFLEGVD